jgi:hypothetical protein
MSTYIVVAMVFTITIGGLINDPVAEFAHTRGTRQVYLIRQHAFF